MSKFARDAAVVPMTPTTDHTDKKGYLVKNSAGSAALNDSATVAAIGVIMDGEDTDGKSAIGILGCLGGTVYARAGGAIVKNGLLMQKADGTVEADSGAGARVVVGRAMEAATVGALFEAALFTPITYAA